MFQRTADLSTPLSPREAAIVLLATARADPSNRTFEDRTSPLSPDERLDLTFLARLPWHHAWGTGLDTAATLAGNSKGTAVHLVFKPRAPILVLLAFLTVGAVISLGTRQFGLSMGLLAFGAFWLAEWFVSARVLEHLSQRTLDSAAAAV